MNIRVGLILNLKLCHDTQEVAIEFPATVANIQLAFAVFNAFEHYGIKVDARNLRFGF